MTVADAGILQHGALRAAVPSEETGASGNIVAVSGLRKVYKSGKGDVLALDNVDLAIRDKEFVSILGPSGCGKSTLMLIVAGLIRHSGGIIMVGGKTVTQPITDVGIVFQRDLLFDWRTVMGNVMLQAEVRGLDRATSTARARELLARVGLAGFENHHPWELSGGMRQRVSICRALLHEASLLLMDEPFGALDALTRDQMSLDLQRIWIDDRRSVIFVTHSIPEAIFLSDRVVVMSPRPGRIVSDIVIDLPRPRTLDMQESDQFAGYRRQIRETMEKLDILR